MIEKAKAWLKAKKKNYQEGLAILAECGVNRVTLRTLQSRSESIERMDKINYLLSQYTGEAYKPLSGVAIAGSDTDNAEETGHPAPGNQIPDAGKMIEDEEMLKTLPADIQDLVANKRKLFNERNMLSQQITDLTDGLTEGEEIPEGVQKMTSEALSIDEAIKAIDSQIQYYFNHGSLPGQKQSISQVDPKGVEQIKRDIKNKRSNISKAKKAAELNPTDVVKAEKLAKLELELKDLEWQLQEAEK